MEKIAIYVEGNSDKRMLEALIKSEGFDTSRYDFMPKNGIDSLLSGLPTIVKFAQQDIVLIIDADSSFERRKDDVIRKLGELYHQDSKPDPEGFIVIETASAKQTQIHLWIMPNNQGPGQLETMLLDAISSPIGATQLREVTTWLNQMASKEPKLLLSNPNKRDKAKFATWLALQSEPATSPDNIIPLLSYKRNQYFKPLLAAIRQLID